MMDVSELRSIWRKEQAELKQRLILTNNVGWVLPPCSDIIPTFPLGCPILRLIGGLDISFYPSPKSEGGGLLAGEPNQGVAALVVLTYPELQVVYEDYEALGIDIPYMPGFLAFREVPVYARLLERARSTNHMPEVVVVDGCGVLHPEGFGAACHLGIVTGVPTIGVAKNLLCVEGLDRESVHRMLREPVDLTSDTCLDIGRGPLGRCVPLISASSGCTLGVALRPGSAINPVYVSVGHRVGLTTALELVWSCCKFRVPEPTRQADIRSREYIRNCLSGG